MVGGWGNERFSGAYFVGGNNNYMRLMHGFLVATNEKTELVPGIATDWRISSDGLTTTVTIRKGVKFHDGTELTAEDVLWSWRHMWSTEALAYATGIGAQAQGRIWDKAELTGPDKVSLTHKIKNPAFITAELAEAGPSMYNIQPKRATLHDAAVEAAFDKNPIGTGAMKHVRRVPASVMELERFDDYYYQPKNGLPEDRRVRFKSLDLRLVPEEATRVAAIRAGEADMAPVTLGSKKQVEAGGAGWCLAGRG
jgi:peptide/nickel transport system substrate-binding protein